MLTLYPGDDFSHALEVECDSEQEAALVTGQGLQCWLVSAQDELRGPYAVPMLPTPLPEEPHLCSGTLSVPAEATATLPTGDWNLVVRALGTGNRKVLHVYKLRVRRAAWLIADC